MLIPCTECGVNLSDVCKFAVPIAGDPALQAQSNSLGIAEKESCGSIPHKKAGFWKSALTLIVGTLATAFGLLMWHYLPAASRTEAKAEVNNILQEPKTLVDETRDLTANTTWNARVYR